MHVGAHLKVRWGVGTHEVCRIRHACCCTLFVPDFATDEFKKGSSISCVIAFLVAGPKRSRGCLGPLLDIYTKWASHCCYNSVSAWHIRLHHFRNDSHIATLWTARSVSIVQALLITVIRGAEWKGSGMPFWPSWRTLTFSKFCSIFQSSFLHFNCNFQASWCVTVCVSVLPWLINLEPEHVPYFQHDSKWRVYS